MHTPSSHLCFYSAAGITCHVSPRRAPRSFTPARAIYRQSIHSTAQGCHDRHYVMTANQNKPHPVVRVSTSMEPCQVECVAININQMNVTVV